MNEPSIKITHTFPDRIGTYALLEHAGARVMALATPCNLIDSPAVLRAGSSFRLPTSHPLGDPVFPSSPYDNPPRVPAPPPPVPAPPPPVPAPSPLVYDAPPVPAAPFPAPVPAAFPEALPAPPSAGLPLTVDPRSLGGGWALLPPEPLPGAPSGAVPFALQEEPYPGQALLWDLAAGAAQGFNGEEGRLDQTPANTGTGPGIEGVPGLEEWEEWEWRSFLIEEPGLQEFVEQGEELEHRWAGM